MVPSQVSATNGHSFWDLGDQALKLGLRGPISGVRREVDIPLETRVTGLEAGAAGHHFRCPLQGGHILWGAPKGALDAGAFGRQVGCLAAERLLFPDTYRDIDGAMAESRRLNEWIEAVLASSPSGRVRAVAGGADVPAQERGGGAPAKGPGRSGASRTRGTGNV